MKQKNQRTQNVIQRPIVLSVIIIVVVASIFFLSTRNNESQFEETEQTQTTQHADLAPDVRGISEWINTEPFSLEDLRGKVVIIDFWTYSCINCIRTLPYLVEWDTKYREDGLVIIGVHTPEFEFEKNIENVKAAVAKYGIEYPVILDNEYATWRAYKNRYWPRKYIIDVNGTIRYDHIGEGGYEETEKQIRELLTEASLLKSADSTTVALEPNKPYRQLTPEIYLGAQFIAAHNQEFGNENFKPNQKETYQIPLLTKENVVYLGGEWTSTSDSIISGKNAELFLRFTAAQIHEVMSADSAKKIAIVVDNNMTSTLIINRPDLYTLFDGAYEKHTIRITVPEGVTMHSFTFG